MLSIFELIPLFGREWWFKNPTLIKRGRQTSSYSDEDLWWVEKVF